MPRALHTEPYDAHVAETKFKAGENQGHPSDSSEPSALTVRRVVRRDEKEIGERGEEVVWQPVRESAAVSAWLVVQPPSQLSASRAQPSPLL